MLGVTVPEPREANVFNLPESQLPTDLEKCFRLLSKDCCRSGDGFLGYFRPGHRRGIRVPARSEVVVWGRAPSGPPGRTYYGLLEALPEPGAVGIARTLAVVRNGRVPVRIRNLNPFSLSMGRYQKLGRISKVDEVVVHGARDLSLTRDIDWVVEVRLVEACSDQGTENSLFEVSSLFNRPDLTEQQQDALTALLQKWEAVFARNDKDFGRTDIVQHRIPTGDSDPIRERFRPLPPMMYQEMRTLLASMLEGGIICESSSPWAAPIVMVKKKDGSWRFCVDFRKFNNVTHKDAFPLPRIEETLPSLKQSGSQLWIWPVDIGKSRCTPRIRKRLLFPHPWAFMNFSACHLASVTPQPLFNV